MVKKDMNIALLGFGTVGYGVYEMAKKTDNLNVLYVLDLVKHDDITAKSVTDIKEILSDEKVDTVVELIGGRQPAASFIEQSLKAGKNVITANKLVICENYKYFTDLATENRVALRYTAAVGGGIPWLTNLERIIRVGEVSSVCGIFNGTTNYILDSMHKDGTDFSVALKSAQDLGFAEADPSSDIDGLDTQRKICISANVAFGVCVDKDDVNVRGISGISAKMISDFENHNLVCRLIAKAERNADGVSVFVEPTLVKNDSAYASVNRNYNRISYEAQYVGNGSFFGFGAGRYPTAYTVINDLIDVANGVNGAYNPNTDKICIDNSLSKHRYFVSMPAANNLQKSLIEDVWGSGVVTKEMTVKEMHAFADNYDGEIFAAGID